jgi:HEAT repeat protein
MAVDRKEAIRRAAGALDAGRPEDALAPLWALVDRSHVPEEELTRYLRMMARAFGESGRSRAEATVRLYLGEAEAAFRASDAPTDRARAAIQGGRRADAARYYEEAGWLGHAAIELEEAGDDRGARVLWERLTEDRSLRDDPYTAGLVRFNLGRACQRLGDPQAGRRSLVASIHLLEAAADGFEARGLRERAFDCFQVILTLGREGAFENLAEGYLNCVRILREDNLRYYVLQYYEDFQALAVERGELHAAATLFREAGDFARRQNMPYERHYRRRAAEAYVAAAEKTLRDGGAVELVENAYAAAIDSFNHLGAYSDVREVYRALAQLPLADKRKARYERLAERLAGVPDEAGQVVAFPDYLRMDTAYPEIWRLDVVEWEQRGDAAETMGEVLQDPKWPHYTRRLALLCRLHQLGAKERVPIVDTLVGLTARLGRVGIYAALAPLERYFEHDEPRVRAACLRATRELFFKRSFVLVVRGLKDPEPEVRKEALAAVQALHFAHAFDPLSRIYRSAADPEVRRTALGSIGRIPSVQAVEMLIDVLRHGDREERDLAVDLLSRSDHPETSELLRKAHAAETGRVRSDLERALTGRRF